MGEIIFRREVNMMPRVVLDNDALHLTFYAGSDMNRDPRVFRLPITQAHFKVIQSDLGRHFLLWAALLPLGDAAGPQGSLDRLSAQTLLDTILLGKQPEIETLFRKIKWHRGQLIAHHADPALLSLGKILPAVKSLTIEADWNLAKDYDASHRHPLITPLDEALLRYTNSYHYGGGLPARKPIDVSPKLLPQVLEVIAVAEKACGDMELPLDYGDDYEDNHKRDKKTWNSIKAEVEKTVHAAFPSLRAESVEAISNLMCTEAASRANSA